ncbi:hypothetical protein [Fictibacillus gelatini]|uniref:hypothetical protein n=1 Tax=Fictibacillus gelatini TaxID=225985 RepID=UPI0004167B74|nr:hypothetical protein [Fictibacillus gelatini]
MKKLLLFLILLVLAGCNEKYIFLSGDGDHWKGEYSANIEGDREDGKYTFRFKHGGSDTRFRKLNIVINNGETVLKKSDYKGATVKIPSSCSGCSVTDDEKSIEVTIKWGDHNEETFYLK